jgi:hypothetical protein
MKNKKNLLMSLGLLAGAYIIYKYYKGGGKPYVFPTYQPQLNAPTGTRQVYSKVGTQLFDKNMNLIYTYEYLGVGMTITGFKNGIYSVVYGLVFDGGLPAYVRATDVIEDNNITASTDNSNLDNINNIA